jgi:putative DNA primase/helicase
MFDRIPNGETPASFAELLTRNSHRCYGAPLRHFLGWMVPQPDQCAKRASDIIKAFVREILPDTTSGEIVSIGQRFGLAAAGGILATQAGTTDWNADGVWDAIVALFREWLAARGSTAPSDEDRAVRQVKDILQTDASRFVDIASAGPDQGPNAVRDQLGFRKQDDGGQTLFLIWSGSWEATFCRGLDPEFVARVLANRGFLVKNRDRRLQYQSRVPGYADPKWFYAIREAILD